MAHEMKELEAVNDELRKEIEAYRASVGKHGDPVAEAKLKAKAEALEAQIGKVRVPHALSVPLSAPSHSPQVQRMPAHTAALP